MRLSLEVDSAKRVRIIEGTKNGLQARKCRAIDATIRIPSHADEELPADAVTQRTNSLLGNSCSSTLGP